MGGLAVLAIAATLTSRPAVLMAVAVPSVVWVRAGSEGVGTGWIADAERRLAVTCRHVVGDRKEVEIFFPRFDAMGNLVADPSAYLGDRERLRRDGLLVTGKVLRTSAATDLAVMELESLPKMTRGLSLAERRPRVGEPVWCVGHRGDLGTLWNFTDGPVRQSGPLVDGYFWRSQKLANGAVATVAQLSIEEGDSGGPVLNAKGQVIGVAAALRRRTPLAAVVIDASEVSKALASGGVQPRRATQQDVGVELRRSPLIAATVWLRPTATDMRCAGVLIGPKLILSSNHGVGPTDRVGVLFPLTDHQENVGELAAYRDPVSLHLRGVWQAGRVVGRNAARDLALVRVDVAPPGVSAMSLANADAQPGELVHSVSHPLGLEFAWMYAAGVVRQRGPIQLVPGAADELDRVPTMVLQLPTQAAAPGGPVANDRGELIGVLAAKDGTHGLVGYAATVGEIREFLAAQPLRDIQRWFDATRDFADIRKLAALAWSAEAQRLQRVGDAAKSAAACDKALSLDPDCQPALLMRGTPADLDRILDLDPWNRPARQLRAETRLKAQDPKGAAADLGKLLDVWPGDAAVRRRFAAAKAAAGDEERAILEFVNTVRLDATQFPAVVADLLVHTDESLLKNPDSPGTVADTLARGLTAAATALPTGPKRDEVLRTLTTAGKITDGKARLAAVRSIKIP